MEVIYARNVNDAYVKGLELLRLQGERSPSRAGEVLVCPIPVTTVYQRPQERVLFDAKRDANPFFHLFESLWLLNGQQDARWLDQFVGDFSSRFAESDGIMHGAYGHRWRYAFGFDQLDVVVEKLRKDPTDRQCVIQMWDSTDSGLGGYERQGVRDGYNDLRGTWKDRPCNTHVYLRVRQELETVGASSANGLGGAHQEPVPYLDITVCCRSNDAIWGAYGSNVVHFSILQEYLAARIGVSIGRYFQVSNNFHVYVDMLDKVGIPRVVADPYTISVEQAPTPLVDRPGKLQRPARDFDDDLTRFMRWTNYLNESMSYSNSWFRDTAAPLYLAHRHWKSKEREQALDCVLDASNISPDWRRAALGWMNSRMAKLGGLKRTSA